MPDKFSYILCRGTLLQRRYRTDAVPGENGFGTTHMAVDNTIISEFTFSKKE